MFTANLTTVSYTRAQKPQEIYKYLRMTNLFRRTIADLEEPVLNGQPILSGQFSLSFSKTLRDAVSERR